ncbi:unnamed protein product, partial [Ectocarpus fasciculatus]
PGGRARQPPGRAGPGHHQPCRRVSAQLHVRGPRAARGQARGRDGVHARVAVVGGDAHGQGGPAGLHHRRRRLPDSGHRALRRLLPLGLRPGLRRRQDPLHAERRRPD